MSTKKVYSLGGNDLTPEQKKEASEAREKQLETTKDLLERQSLPAQAHDVEKIIKNFPWRPHQDRVVVLPDPSEAVLPSGIVIPDTAQEKPQSGVLISVGEEVTMSVRTMEHLVAIRKALYPKWDDSSDAPYMTESKPGDRVLFGKYAGLEIEIEGVRYLVMRFADIMATLK